jgi:HEAT repeat protein
VLAAYALRDTPDGKVEGILPLLGAAARSSDPTLCEAARGTVQLLAPRAGSLLIRAALKPDGPGAGPALELLALGGADVAGLIAESLLTAEDWRVRRAGLEVLGKMGAEAQGVLGQIERCGMDPESEVRREALKTLAALPADQALFRAAQRATRDPEPRIRARAWRALVHSPQLLERARDPALAPALAEALEAQFPRLPPDLRRALDEGLGGAAAGAPADGGSVER